MGLKTSQTKILAGQEAKAIIKATSNGFLPLFFSSLYPQTILQIKSTRRRKGRIRVSNLNISINSSITQVELGIDGNEGGI